MLANFSGFAFSVFVFSVFGKVFEAHHRTFRRLCERFSLRPLARSLVRSFVRSFARSFVLSFFLSSIYSLRLSEFVREKKRNTIKTRKEKKGRTDGSK